MLNTHGHLFFEGPWAVRSFWNEVHRWVCDVVLCSRVWSSAGQNASVTWQSNPHLLDIRLDMPCQEGASLSTLVLFWAQIQILSRSLAIPRQAIGSPIYCFLLNLSCTSGWTSSSSFAVLLLGHVFWAPKNHPHAKMTRCSEINPVLGWEVVRSRVSSFNSYHFAAQAEWVLSETMTGFLENFNLLRMFRVARIIRPLTLSGEVLNSQHQSLI